MEANQQVATRLMLEQITRLSWHGAPDHERFWDAVQFTDDCWLWKPVLVDGYGRFAFVVNGQRRSVGAHRWAWEYLNGPAPAGLDPDHLCRNTACVNPWHLEWVTHQENVRRGRLGEVQRARQTAKTHCPRGHEYSGENLYDRPSPDGKTHRRCRECARLLALKRYHARRTAS